jgi:hypothetical protein
MNQKEKSIPILENINGDNWIIWVGFNRLMMPQLLLASRSILNGGIRGQYGMNGKVPRVSGLPLLLRREG